MPNSPVQYHECPHCYSNVMFYPDGICPSCHKSKFDMLHVDQDKTMVTIDHNHRVPDHCFMCGVETPLRKQFSWSYGKGSSPSLLARLMSYMPGGQHRERHQVQLPVCMPCTPLARRVKPLSVWAGLECRMVVHRTFRQQFEQLNGKETLEWQADLRLTDAPKDPSSSPEFLGVGSVKL